MRWFVYASLAMAALMAVSWSEPELRYFALGGGIAVALQALVYAPRAWRANKTRQRGSQPDAP
jgi:F0F1-type ATP synthase assembly protein I